MTPTGSYLRSSAIGALILSSVVACSQERDRAPDAALPDVHADAEVCEPPEVAPSPGARCKDDVLRIHVRPVDATNQYPLFADTVEVVVPGCEETIGCERLSPRSFRCEVPRGAAPDDRLTLIGTLDGEAHEVEVPYRFEGYPPDESSCQYDANLLLPAPGCSDPEATAVEGRVLDVPDDATLRVSLLEPYKWDGDVLYGRGRLRECQMEGTHYRCPALGYQSHYLLWVRDGAGNLAQRDVHVRSDGCDIHSTHYDVRPEACDVEIWLPAETDASADAEISLSFLSSAGEVSLPCTYPLSSRDVLRCEVPATHRSVSGTPTIRSSNGASISNSSLRIGGQCPQLLREKLEMQTTSIRPTYGVPNVLLSLDEMRALGLAQADD